MDWQIWIEQGEKALPRKLVITYKDSPGYPQFTVFRELLINFCNQRSIRPPEFREFISPSDAARLFPQEIAGIIGPPAFMQIVRQELKDRLVYEFPKFVFPWVSFDVFIRRKADPSNIRRFLEAVTLSTQLIETLRKDQQSPNIAARLIPNMSRDMWLEPLPYVWKVEGLEPDILLELWKREAEMPNHKIKK